MTFVLSTTDDSAIFTSQQMNLVLIREHLLANCSYHDLLDNYIRSCKKLHSYGERQAACAETCSSQCKHRSRRRTQAAPSSPTVGEASHCWWTHASQEEPSASIAALTIWAASRPSGRQKRGCHDKYTTSGRSALWPVSSQCCGEAL